LQNSGQWDRLIGCFCQSAVIIVVKFQTAKINEKIPRRYAPPLLRKGELTAKDNGKKKDCGSSPQ
jgi:hypothetical protein